MAVAHISGEAEIRLGATPQAELAASLSPLGDQAATVLMADPQLLNVSRQL
jgi:hypothetical protein